MKQLKIYGGMLTNPNPPLDRPLHKRQERVIAAVYSQKELVDIIKNTEDIARVSLNEIRNYWCVTGNQEEIKLALAHPHQLIWTGGI